MSDGVTGREAAVDAGLAVLVFAGVLVAGVATDAALDPPAALAGALATLAFEAVAGRHAATVRRVWRRGAVKVASLALAAVLVAVGLAVAPDPAVSAAGGVLGTYLLVLALVRVGVLPPPAEWMAN